MIGDVAKKAPTLKYATAPLPKGTLMVPVDLYVAEQGTEEPDRLGFRSEGERAGKSALAAREHGLGPNRKGLDYSAVLGKIPQLDAFVNTPPDHVFFTVPAISPASEILTRLAARLEKAFTDKSLAGNDAAIDAFLKAAAEESDKILAREDLLAKP